MSKTFLRSLSASTLLLVGYHILMPYPVLHAARTVQTVGLKQTSDEFLKKWLEQDVVYIITDEEKASFKRLTTDDERYQFIESFWLRRDPSPDTIENETRDEHYRRIAYANQRYSAAEPGWRTDRGRIYITWGPPDQIESHPSGDGRTDPFEIWRYRAGSDGNAASERTLVFGGTDYKLLQR
jgi:GWxTD domain-containing protein